MTDKPFITIEQQIALLENERHLTFLNREAAKNTLRRYGYYEIVNGYKENYLNNPADDSAGYKSTATFEHIFAMFTLDKRIREDILRALEEFETSFKQALAYAVAEDVSDSDKYYTAPSHYNAGSSHMWKGKKYIERDRLLKNFKDTMKSPTEPFKHYKTHHGNIPPWIMVKGMSFGNVMFWYRLSKPIVRRHVISIMFGLDTDLVDVLDTHFKIKQAFGDMLDLFLNYRNLCAHGGRVYNHRSAKHQLRQSKFLYREAVIEVSRNKFLKGEMRSSPGVVLTCLKLFENKDPYNELWIWLSIDISHHLKKFPEDKEYLINSMELTDKKCLDSISEFQAKKDSR